MDSGTTSGIAAPSVRDLVDVTSEDSFPASDPPSWTPIVGSGPPCRVGRRGGVDARAARDEAPVPARAVLHPTDYSDASRCAFQLACRQTPGGRVTVLHVPDRRAGHGSSGRAPLWSELPGRTSPTGRSMSDHLRESGGDRAQHPRGHRGTETHGKPSPARRPDQSRCRFKASGMTHALGGATTCDRLTLGDTPSARSG